VSWCAGTVLRLLPPVFKGRGAAKVMSKPGLLVVSFDDGTMLTVAPDPKTWNLPESGGWRWKVVGDEAESEDEDIVDAESSDEEDDDGDDDEGVLSDDE
jgi:hypothetical protein